MYSKFTEYLTLILLVLILSSCSAVQGHMPPITTGDVIPVSYSSTIAGMKMAVQGVQDTYIMAKDGLTMLIWPMRGCQGVGFVVLDTSQEAFLDQWEYVSSKGNFTSGSSMKVLADYLTGKSGWKVLSASALSDSIKSAILAAGGTDTWITLASRIPVFMIVFDVPTVNPLYSIYKGEY